MKFNFGTGVVIAMGIFMVFILQYVIRVQFDSEYDNELVTEDYYQQELEVDGKYAREVKALKLNSPLVISTTDLGDISVVFPESFESKNIEGTIFLYRPSNQKLDFEIPLSLTSSDMIIMNDELVDGRWDIAIEWTYEGNAYRNVKSLIVEKKG